MTITPTALLSLPIITTGTESGTWGDVVDNGLTSYLDIAIAGGLAITMTNANRTLTNTAGTSSATNIGSTTAQYAILNISGAMVADLALIIPISSRTYVINNACTGGYRLTVRGISTLGVSLRNGESAYVAWNGSDYVKVGPGATITGDNTAVGKDALMKNDPATGLNNTAFGASALAQSADSYNTAIGAFAMYASTTGNFNTAIGHRALYVTSGTRNVAIGPFSMDGATTAGDCVAVGRNTLRGVLSNGANTAIGTNALTLTSGQYNTALGYYAGENISTGSGNIAFSGYTSSGSNAPAFNITTQSNYISMGSTAVTNAYVQVAWTVVSDARDKTDFADVPHGLDFVSKLQPTAYRFKENRDATEGHGPVRYGFKAQDVLALEGDAPVIIDADNPDKLYFNDQSMIAVLVNAIKELKAEFDAYKAAHA